MTIFGILLCLGAICGQIAVSAGDGPPIHWRYIGIYGVYNWSVVSEICNTATHHHQSPVDIVHKDVKVDNGLTPLSLVVDRQVDQQLTVVNNGHTVNIDFGANVLHAVGGRLSTKYRIGGVHFHWGAKDNVGSEHKINGKQFPMEMHIVTYDDSRYSGVLDASNTNTTDAIAVLGVFFTITNADNPALTTFISHLKEVLHSGNLTKIPYFELKSLLPSNTANYYRYMGSLTTPPCAESVIWSVFDTPNTISLNQLKQFRSLEEEIEPDGTIDYISNNYRPVQELHDRTVQSSFHPSSASHSQPSNFHSPVITASYVILLLFAPMLTMHT